MTVPYLRPARHFPLSQRTIATVIAPSQTSLVALDPYALMSEFLPAPVATIREIWSGTVISEPAPPPPGRSLYLIADDRAIEYIGETANVPERMRRHRGATQNRPISLRLRRDPRALDFSVRAFPSTEGVPLISAFARDLAEQLCAIGLITEAFAARIETVLAMSDAWGTDTRFVEWCVIALLNPISNQAGATYRADAVHAGRLDVWLKRFVGKAERLTRREAEGRNER